MAAHAEYYSSQTMQCVETINTSSNEQDRHDAIRAIITSTQKDKARLLIELFQYSAWRDTQGALLRAIGATGEVRGVEFLIRFIRHTADLPMATQATIGLGKSQTPLAGEFLLSILRKTDSRLRLEALKGLALMPQFYCDDQLTDIIENEDSQEDLRIHAIIAAGRRGAKQALPAIQQILVDGDEHMIEAALLAIGHLANTTECIHQVDQLDSQLILSELKDYVSDRIYQRTKLNVEDLIINAISDDKVDWPTRFRLLREAPPSEVWGALEILGENLDPKVECVIRAATHDLYRAELDVAFLIAKESQLDFIEAANLARLCVNSAGPSFIKNLKPLNACKLLKQVRIAEILAFSDLYFDPETDPTLAIAYINAVVAQCYMSWKVNPACVLFIKAQLNITNNRAVLDRLLRALAQLGCTDHDYLDRLAIDIENQALQASTSYCLSLLPSHYSAPILTAYLEKAFDAGSNVDAIIERLSLLGSVNGLVELPPFSESTQSRCAKALLRILSFNKINGFDAFLEAQLSFGNHAQQLLAISAIAKNGKHWHCELLFSLLNSDNKAIQTRAIHSLCLRGNAEQHHRLLQWFAQEAFESDIATLIFNKLHPNPQEDYNNAKRLLEQLIRDRRGPFVDDEILAAALSVYDNIAVLSSEKKEHDMPTASSRHTQDAILADEIRAYSDYSETIKIILRNAELTWQHTELFNHVVDKSTMLVQYSKSTDLLLQQRIGLPVFQNADDEFLSMLQTRVMELGLNTATFGQARMIRHLKLEGFFTTKEFPAHKLKTLTESIMSGKIMADRFRAIDGLRAWSLILLLFARTFVINGKKFTPLIPMRKSGEEKINALVKSMNKFQDLRNSAAHHGVLVEPELLAEIRSDSFALLNELEEVLALPSKH